VRECGRVDLIARCGKCGPPGFIKRGGELRRLITASIAIFLLALGTGSATAASSGAEVDTLPAQFSISATETNGVPGGCQYLPPDVEITWEGTLKSITVVRFERDGALTVQNTSVASGKATDQDGNTYAFSYSNQFRVTETTAGSGLFTGTMTDHFSLAGNGTVLNNGFLAEFTTNFDDVFEFDPIWSRGDPLDFDTGAPRCDPL
jgi:hypothetical protein